MHRGLEGGSAWVPGVWGRKECDRSLTIHHFPFPLDRGGLWTWPPVVPWSQSKASSKFIDGKLQTLQSSPRVAGTPPCHYFPIPCPFQTSPMNHGALQPSLEQNSQFSTQAAITWVLKGHKYYLLPPSLTMSFYQKGNRPRVGKWLAEGHS